MKGTLPMFGPPPMPPNLEGNLLRVASILYDARPHAITSADLAERIGWPRSKKAHVTHICSTLIDEYKLPIAGERKGGAETGYRLCESHEEFVEAQMPNLRQAVTTILRIGARIGRKRLEHELVRLGIRAIFELTKWKGAA